jgi:hypothetical protein
MAGTEKPGRAAERLAETTRASYETLIGHAVGLQERNARFAQGVVESLAGEYRQQVEANRTVARELVERATEQRDAFRAVVEESLEAYVNLLRAPFSYYEEGLETARKVAR